MGNIMAKAANLSKTSKYQNIADKVRASTIGAGEPKVSKETYKIDLIRAFGYYHTYEEPKVLRKWVIEYIGKDSVKLAKLDQVHDLEIEKVAILLRLREREQYLEPNEINHIDKRLQAIFDRPLKEIKVGQTSNDQKAIMALSLAKKSDEIIRTHIGNLEGEIDSFILGGYKSDFEIGKYLEDHKITPAQLKIIHKWASDQIPELEIALEGKDEYINESYAFTTKPKLKKWISFVESIMAACVQQKVAVVRKPTKIKVKLPAELVKNLKYAQAFDELNIKSIHPTKLIGASEVWLYNHKYRRMHVYKSIDDNGLSVKGSRFIGFNTVTSESRTIRKPEEWMKLKAGKREYASEWKNLTTSVSVPNGQINSDCVILAVF